MRRREKSGGMATYFHRLFFQLVLFSFLFILFSPSGDAASAHTWMADSITQYGITWTFDKEYQVGRFIGPNGTGSGDYFVIDSGAGVIVKSKTPTPTSFSSGRAKHGSMVNPQKGKVNDKFHYQAYDSSIGKKIEFDENLALIFPGTLHGGDSLVSTISYNSVEPRTDYIGVFLKDNPPIMEAAAVLTVLDNVPHSDAFRPPYAGTDKPLFRKSQIDYSLLPKKNPSEIMSQLDNKQYFSLRPGRNPSKGTVAEQFSRYIERPWILHVEDFTGRKSHPAQNMPNYHREVYRLLTKISLLLTLDLDKRDGAGQLDKLIIPFVQLGIDSHYITKTSNPGSADSSISKLPVLFAGHLLNNNAMKSNSYNFRTEWMTYYINEGESSILSTKVSGNNKKPFKNIYTLYKDPINSKVPAFRQDPGNLEHEHLDPSTEWDKISDGGGSKREDYRQINSVGYAGHALAARILGLEGYWSHPALFDYVKRYVNAEDEGTGSPFSDAMFEKYWKIKQEEKSGFAGTSLKNSVTKDGITWTFSKKYEAGQFINGDWFVIDGGEGVTVSGVSPSPSSGKHGSMINPGKSYNVNKQGYDSRIDNKNYVGSISYPADLKAGDSLVSTESADSGNAEFGTCYGGKRYIDFIGQCAATSLKRASVLTVLDSVPPVDAFRPAYVGSSKPIRRFSDLQLNLLPKLSYANKPNDLSYYERLFERTWLDHKAGHTGRQMHPYLNLPNYGEEVSEAVSAVSLLLLMDYSDTQIKNLLTYFVQTGIDLYAMNEAGSSWYADGGHGSGRKWPIMFAGILLDHSGMKTVSGSFQEEEQVYFSSQVNLTLWGQDCSTHGACFFDNGCQYDSKVCSNDNAETCSTNSDCKEGASCICRPGDCCSGAKDCRDPSFIVDGCSNYREGDSSHAWPGFVLSAKLLKDKSGNSGEELWNYVPLFDYVHRWLANDYTGYSTKGGGSLGGSHGDKGHPGHGFIEGMWNTYGYCETDSDCSGHPNGLTCAPIPDPCRDCSWNKKECSTVQSSCTSDSQCDDGLFCNGAEICSSGSCISASAPACEDDGYSCTTECNENTDSCDISYGHSSCNDGNSCTDDSCIGSGGDAVTGCLHVADDSNTCSLSGECAVNAHCSAGSCVATADSGLCSNPQSCGVVQCSSSYQCSYSQCPIPHDLALYLSFDGNYHDLSLNTHPVSCSGASCPSLTVDKDSNTDSAYHFDGTNDFITVSGNSVLGDLDAFTLSAWYNPTGAPGEGWGRIISKPDDGTGDDYALVHVATGNNRHKIQFRASTTQGTSAYTDVTVPIDSGWHHIAGVWDGSTKKIYLNGRLAGSGAGTGALQNSGNDLTIGRHLNSNTRGIIGDIDDVRLYHSALSTIRIEELASSAPLASSNVSCSNGVQDDNENGVDCGGVCTTECAVSCPVHDPFIPSCLSAVCSEGELQVAQNDALCNDSNDCTIDRCTKVGCRYDLAETLECSALAQNCGDADLDGILDYHPQDCSLGKDICVFEKKKLKGSNLTSLLPHSALLNVSWDSQGSDIRNSSNLVLFKDSAAKIQFEDTVDLVGVNDSGCYSPLNLDLLVELKDKKIVVHSSDFSGLNKKAILTFYNVRYIEPQIRKDGEVCSDCTIVSYDSTLGELQVEVTGFSEFDVIESFVPSESPNSESGPSSSSGGGSSGGGSSSGSGSAGTKETALILTSSWKQEDLGVNDKLLFNYTSESHRLYLDWIHASDKIDISIYSTRIPLSLSKNTIRSVDLTDDAKADIDVRFYGIYNDKARIGIRLHAKEVPKSPSLADTSSEENSRQEKAEQQPSQKPSYQVYSPEKASPINYLSWLVGSLLVLLVVLCCIAYSTGHLRYYFLRLKYSSQMSSFERLDAPRGKKQHTKKGLEPLRMYIRSCLELSYSKAGIRKICSRRGWSKKNIETVMAQEEKKLK